MVSLSTGGVAIQGLVASRDGSTQPFRLGEKLVEVGYRTYEPEMQLERMGCHALLDALDTGCQDFGICGLPRSQEPAQHAAKPLCTQNVGG